jgi:hypothetical protein
MATTNFTITGHDLFIKTPTGEYFQDGGLALVQWDIGYNPSQHPWTEWVNNPVNISWTGWYVKDYQGVGTGIFGSNGTDVNVASPIYLYIDFNNSSNFDPVKMQNQVWMGQVSDILLLNGQDQVINLNASNIRSVVGTFDGTTMTSADWTTWTPTAIPEPSYAPLAVGLFAIAVLWKKLTNRNNQTQ